MRGAPDTQITLTVLRQGEKAPLQVTLTRDVIRIQSVRYEAMEDVGYIRISQFSERTVEGVEDAISSLEDEIGPRLTGYVLDLRANPGGLLDQAIGVTDAFLETGEVVSTRGRRPQDTQRYNARAGDITDNKPIVILVDEGSASASEIVAGALQDHRRATVVGITSFGKGSVQTIIPLGGQAGGALRLTTARYYTPSGRSIQATGIAPDIAVSNLSAADQAQRDQFMIRREASLAGHLDAEGAERDVSMPVIRPEPGTSVDDFQLSYALDRLRGVVMPPVAQAGNSPAVPN
jgi:carboxyl-terminal processing protease